VRVSTGLPLRRSFRLLVLAFAAGCARSPFEQRADDLSAARMRWRTAAISSYDFDLEKSCFCIQEALGPVTISVRNGQFAGIFSTDGGTAVDTMLFQEFLTMDRVFETTQRLLDSRPASFTASYDAALGFPTTVAVDPNAQAVDDELTYQVLSLRPTTMP
jgi:hypothetical protein